MIQLTPTISLLELIYTLFSISGILLMGYVAYDNQRDMLALYKHGVNGYSRLVASIGIWDALAAMIFHALFLVLGVFALITPPPPPERRAFSDLFALGFILMQALILGVQGRNQLARIRIRNRLRQPLKKSDPKWIKRCRECVTKQEPESETENK